VLNTSPEVHASWRDVADEVIAAFRYAIPSPKPKESFVLYDDSRGVIGDRFRVTV